MAVEEHEFRQRLGAALRSARLRKDWTQDQLAGLIESDPETVSRFERGAALPSLVRLLALANALDVTLASLLGAASPRATDEWDKLQRDLAKLPVADQKLAAVLVRALVNARS
jgi:transcriptional regulator with XRE-family HTH domain